MSRTAKLVIAAGVALPDPGDGHPPVVRHLPGADRHGPGGRPPGVRPRHRLAEPAVGAGAAVHRRHRRPVRRGAGDHRRRRPLRRRSGARRLLHRSARPERDAGRAGRPGAGRHHLRHGAGRGRPGGAAGKAQHRLRPVHRRRLVRHVRGGAGGAGAARRLRPGATPSSSWRIAISLLVPLRLRLCRQRPADPRTATAARPSRGDRRGARATPATGCSTPASSSAASTSPSSPPTCRPTSPISGLPPSVSAWSLAMIGLFNIFGSYLFGVLGGRFRQKWVLSAIYLARAVVIALFLLAAAVAASSAVAFGAAIGFLWLGTVPLTSGLVARVFGVRYLSMLYGVVFASHQLGAFLGAWGGGFAYDVLGSYDSVWLASIGACPVRRRRSICRSRTGRWRGWRRRRHDRHAHRMGAAGGRADRAAHWPCGGATARPSSSPSRAGCACRGRCGSRSWRSRVRRVGRAQRHPPSPVSGARPTPAGERGGSRFARSTLRAVALRRRPRGEATGNYHGKRGIADVGWP